MALTQASSVILPGLRTLPMLVFRRQLTFAINNPPDVFQKTASYPRMCILTRRPLHVLRTAGVVLNIHGSTPIVPHTVHEITPIVPHTGTFPPLQHLQESPNLLSLGHRFASSSSTSGNTSTKPPKRKWLRYLGTSILILIGSASSFVAYKLFYDFRRRGVEVFYFPKFPLQLIGGPSGYYKGTTVPTSMLSSIEKTEDFQVRPDDIFVCSFPRSGTTWTQEVVFLISNQADVDIAKSRILDERFPYLEDMDSQIDTLNATESPRFIKTHLPYRLLPKDIYHKKPKIIYVMRNPKDVMVSGYHMYANLKLGFRGNFTEFSETFFKQMLPFSPWVDHVKEFWQNRDEENILFIRYEDLSKDLEKEVKKISKFLKKPLTEEQISIIVDHCSFESMKKNDKVNWWKQSGFAAKSFKFIRKGKVGDWKNYFTPEIESRLKEEVRPLAEVGLELIYEIKSPSNDIK